MKQEILKSLLEKINAYGLHEAVRVRLMEDSNRNILSLTLKLPQKLDPKTNKLIDVKIGTGRYTVTARKRADDPTGTSFTTDEYTGIKGFFFNGTSAKNVTSKKDATTGNISGTFTLTEDIYNYLNKFVGQPMQTSQNVYGSVVLASGGTEVKYAEWTVTKYTQVPATSAPK
jgi:hypothetical protein